MSKDSSALPQEIELKLAVPPADIEGLGEHPLIESSSSQPPKTRRLRSVYFDTPDLRLASQGVVLRVRDTGDGFVQAVKSRKGGSAGLFGRTEIECEVPTHLPDLDRIPDRGFRERLKGELAGSPPEALVETDFQRSSRRVVHRGTELLFELDRGQVRTGAGDAPICELELELVHGDPADLYHLAIALQETVALRPVTVSKADLGFALITGERPGPRKAGTLPTPEGPSLEALWICVLGAGIDHLVANETPACDGVDPEGVHQLRVAARRLRSALSLFAPVLPPGPVEHLRGELRWIGSELGDARDLDVFLDETLEPLRQRTPDGSDLTRLIAEARTLQQEAQERARLALLSPRFPKLVLELGRWLVSRGWREGLAPAALARLDAPARDESRPLIERWHRKVASGARRIRKLDADQRHRLRIRMKKLRYAGDFLRAAHPERSEDARHYVKRLAKLQDTLGLQNDAATSDRLLATILGRIGDEVRSGDLQGAGFVAGCVSERTLRDDRALESEAAAFAKLAPFWEAPSH